MDEIQEMGIVGRHKSIVLLRKEIKEIAEARRSSSVVIIGETGTGKELVARALHTYSDRKNGPFCSINCSAIPNSLVESELFGHRKGSFSGATATHPGLILSANGGTVFLDEVGELPPEIQSKLLRVLQDNVVRAVGDTNDSKVDVRFIFATHRDLKKMVADGTFREDLYYRIMVFLLPVPPLRDRGNDVLEIARHFLHKYGRPEAEFSSAAEKALETFPFSGNVRELENSIKRACVKAIDDVIEPRDLALDEYSIPRQTAEVHDVAGALAREFIASFRHYQSHDAMTYAAAFAVYNGMDGIPYSVEGKDTVWSTFRYFCEKLPPKSLQPFDDDVFWDWFLKTALHKVENHAKLDARIALKGRILSESSSNKYDVLQDSPAMSDYLNALTGITGLNELSDGYVPAIVGARKSGMNAAIRYLAEALNIPNEGTRWIEVKPQDLSRRLHTKEGRIELTQAEFIVVWIHPYDMIDEAIYTFLENLKAGGAERVKRVVLAVTVDYDVLQGLRAPGLQHKRLRQVVDETWGAPHAVLSKLRWRIHVLPTLLERQDDLPGLVIGYLGNTRSLSEDAAKWLTDDDRKPMLDQMSFEDFWSNIDDAIIGKPGPLTASALERAFAVV